MALTPEQSRAIVAAVLKRIQDGKPPLIPTKRAHTDDELDRLLAPVDRPTEPQRAHEREATPEEFAAFQAEQELSREVLARKARWDAPATIGMTGFMTALGITTWGMLSIGVPAMFATGVLYSWACKKKDGAAAWPAPLALAVIATAIGALKSHFDV